MCDTQNGRPSRWTMTARALFLSPLLSRDGLVLSCVFLDLGLDLASSVGLVDLEAGGRKGISNIR